VEACPGTLRKEAAENAEKNFANQETWQKSEADFWEHKKAFGPSGTSSEPCQTRREGPARRSQSQAQAKTWGCGFGNLGM